MKAPEEEVRKLFAQEWSVEKLAKHFGVSVSTIYRRLRGPEISTVPYREMKDGKPEGRAMPQGSVIRGRRK
jgi:DNA invertase Pin-like site-specific DNA recombinase